MKAMRLKTTAKRMLQKASRDAVGNHFQAMTAAERQNTWINANNRYRLSCTDQYHRDSKATPSAVSHAAMLSYIAASCPGHVIDGWSLLGRAIDCLLRNDVYSAIHLAYYAELRAAMALLAAEGVGILNDRHPVVDQSGITSELPQAEAWDKNKNNGAGGWVNRTWRTHAVVWPCLRHWAGLAKSFDLIDELFRPAGCGLEEWLKSLNAQGSAKAVTSKWVKVWGIDLSACDDDHSARNLASYRPSELRLPKLPTLQTTLSFVHDLWRCFEPASVGHFPTFERHVLRRALQLGGVVLPLGHGALASIGISAGEEASWLAVLNSRAEHLLFSHADVTSQIEDEGCHFQVIARAVLLLNLATAAARRHLVRAGYVESDLRFWWRRHCSDRGVLEVQSIPENPTDLWADVNDALSRVVEWVSLNAGQTALANVRHTESVSLSLLGAFENVAIWGLTP